MSVYISVYISVCLSVTFPCNFFRGLLLALRSHDQFEASHWPTLLPYHMVVVVGGTKKPLWRGGGKKIAVSPFVDASGKKISVLLSALVERFGVSGMRDFLKIII